MNGAFYIGATGLDAQQKALDVVAHNLANVNTPGFKRSSIRFSELAASFHDGSDLPTIELQNQQRLGGVSFDASHRVWTQGDLRQTGSTMDLAIDGPGFVELLGSTGHTLLWRGGTLKVSADGHLATSDGTRLAAMISVPQGATDLKIAGDATVTATADGDEGPQEIGRIDIVMTRDADSLSEAGAGYFEATDAADIYTVEAGQEGGGVFAQGSVEQANVQLSEEMVSLLLVQRAYAANAQLVQAGDQLMSIVNSLRR